MQSQKKYEIFTEILQLEVISASRTPITYINILHLSSGSARDHLYRNHLSEVFLNFYRDQ